MNLEDLNAQLWEEISSNGYVLSYASLNEIYTPQYHVRKQRILEVETFIRNKALVAPPTVLFRNNQYTIIDGNHRAYVISRLLNTGKYAVLENGMVVEVDAISPSYTEYNNMLVAIVDSNITYGNSLIHISNLDISEQ